MLRALSWDWAPWTFASFSPSPCLPASLDLQQVPGHLGSRYGVLRLSALSQVVELCVRGRAPEPLLIGRCSPQQLWFSPQVRTACRAVSQELRIKLQVSF